MPHIRSGRIHTDRTWDEYTKLVNFVDKKIFRIKTYGKEEKNSFQTKHKFITF
jgi:hypothetical protein